MHRVAEQFVSLYKLVGHQSVEVPQKNTHRVRYLQAVKSLLSDPVFLVQAPPSAWLDAWGALTKEHVGEPFENVAQGFVADITSTLFSPGDEGPSELRHLLMQETVKRAFLRLVITDLARLAATPELQPGGFPEFRVELQLGGLSLRGRVDRVDFSPRGYHIIDYKTSKVRRTEVKLVLLPQEAVNDKARLSVQGALYTLAWCRSHEEHPVADFTLYRLKNLDEDADVFLSADFDGQAVDRRSATYSQLEATYERLASNLSAGRFPANPRSASVCLYCPAFHVCPKPRDQSVGGSE